MSKSLVKLVAGVALLGLPLFAAEAQTCAGTGTVGCNVNTTASLTIPSLFRLVLTGDSITLLTPDFSNTALSGQNVTTTVATLTVSANTSWELSVSTAATDFTYVGSEGGARAASMLEVEETCASTTWTAISSTPVVAAFGTVTNNAAGSLCLRTNFPADYSSTANRPGVYQLPVTLTLAAP